MAKNDRRELLRAALVTLAGTVGVGVAGCGGNQTPNSGVSCYAPIWPENFHQQIPEHESGDTQNVLPDSDDGARLPSPDTPDASDRREELKEQ